ncbi:hypothetical protein [Parahaliea mediterranea]|uniref:hypothetical protein n=1 Tax=Parahaliea mediterranea TaxID=651086 RepID=UPI000E2E4AF9|nr:hypothetical protein [Parahaliea mediterranea]
MYFLSFSPPARVCPLLRTLFHTLFHTLFRTLFSRAQARAIALALLATGPAVASEAADAGSSQDALGAAFSHYLEQLQGAEQALRAHPFYGSDVERAGAYSHLFRSVRKSIEQDILQDRDFPYFRSLDLFSREGGDNPDQKYLFAPIDGTGAYRVWGQRGDATRVEIQVYAGKPWAGNGRSAGFISHDDIAFADDGSFSLRVSSRPADKPDLLLPEDASELFVRFIYGDWQAQRPGAAHIDRIGYEGRPLPQPASKQLAADIRQAGDELYTAAVTWPRFVEQRYVNARPANTLSPLLDTSTLGGVPGRWMSSGHFQLAPGQAVVLRIPQTTAVYQAVQLTDPWFASLEYGNRTSSFNREQSLQAPDGAYYYVLSAQDPGYQNWLDPVGLGRGAMLLRFDGVNGDIPKAQWPSAQVVAMEDLASAIPGFATGQLKDREAQLAARRRHLQQRFGR